MLKRKGDGYGEKTEIRYIFGTHRTDYNFIVWLQQKHGKQRRSKTRFELICRQEFPIDFDLRILVHLDDRHLTRLDRLIRRGVEAITVLVVDPRDAETIANDLAAAEARVDYIFRDTGSPSRNTLRQTILAYRLENAR